MEYTVTYKQTLIDISLAAQGTATTLFANAAELGISITGALLPGQVLQLSAPPGNAGAGRIAALLSRPQNMPASADDMVAGTYANLPVTIIAAIQPLHVVQRGQALIDMAMQYQGDSTALFSLAVQQGLGITDALTPGDAVIRGSISNLTAAQKAVIRTLSTRQPASDGWSNTATGGGVLNYVVPVPNPPKGVRVERGQCPVDLAMQHLGSASFIFPMAAGLGLNITESLTPGDYYKVETATNAPAELKKMIRLLNEKRNIPASDINKDGPPLTVKLEGIDYWFLYEYEVQ